MMVLEFVNIFGPFYDIDEELTEQVTFGMYLYDLMKILVLLRSYQGASAGGGGGGQTKRRYIYIYIYMCVCVCVSIFVLLHCGTIPQNYGIVLTCFSPSCNPSTCNLKNTPFRHPAKAPWVLLDVMRSRPQPECFQFLRS